MASPEVLLDPTGMDERTADHTLAPRPTSLRGATIALVDNTKPNATALLNAIADELKRRYGVGATPMYTKDYFGTPIRPELLEEVAGDCDAVITAVGDCGSCSAATVADGILFERAGVPAVSICSDAFRMSGSAMAQVQGFSGFEYLTVKHPVSSLNDAELRERAGSILPDIARILGAESGK
ncbi:MAG: UGSC family (seleno)protein [Pseudoclavibacter sp.]